MAPVTQQATGIAFPGVPGDRERARQALLDAEPIPVADWPELKRDLLDAHATPSLRPPPSTAASP